MIRPDDHLLRGTITEEISLLEASAGTGKTFTISHRVVRLLLERAIPIQDILVVTFTRAATRELRDRIRKVIVEARDALARSLAGQAPEKPAPALERVLARDEAGQRRALSLAKRALDHLDLASVQTIHGFCERALSLHALELGYDTGSELTASIEAALAAVVDDLYVERIAAASKAELHFLGATGYAPSALRGVAKSVFALRESALAPAEAPAFGVDEWMRRREAWISAIEAQADELSSSVAPHLAKFSSRGAAEDAKRSGLRSTCARAAVTAASKLSSILSMSPPTEIANLLPQKLQGWARPGETIDHPLLLELETLGHQGRLLANLAFREVAARVPALVEEELARRGELGFDQLIGAVHRVVSTPEGAARLRETLGARYQAVLIDEFQDTDEAQWAIFHALFGEGKVFDLVGDPKQAIYAFRGADVHAYAAAKELARARATMSVNYRSDAAYVEAMNRFFGLDGTPAPGEAPPRRRTLGSEEIEYIGVRASEANTEPRLLGHERAPLSLVRLTNETGGRGRAAVVAESIVELLNRGAELREEQRMRALRPGDVAVLVRAGRIGREIAEELRTRGVPYVTSQSAGVWGTEAAALLDALLTAALNPHDRGILRAVALDRLFDLPATALDDRGGRLSRVAALVREVRASIEAEGVAAAVVNLLTSTAGEDGQTVAAHLLGHLGGERLVTDLRHLAELLHLEAVAESLGVEELVQRLRERRAESAQTADQEHQQRLESDADSVNITTIHSSKGLEYPVVFLPDLDKIRVPQASDLTLDYHDARGKRTLDVGAWRTNDDALERAILATRKEAMRLLYVAVTRARCHATLFFHLPDDHAWQGSQRRTFALSPLAAALFGEGEGEARLESAVARVGVSSKSRDFAPVEELLEGVRETVARAEGALSLHDASAPGSTLYRPREPELRLQDALTYAGPAKLDYGYGDYSYSSVIRTAEHALEERGGMDERELSPEEPWRAPGAKGDRVPLAALAAGAGVGTFVHGVMEDLDFVSREPKAGRGASVYGLALERARREGLLDESNHAELLVSALPGILDTPLGGELGDLRLGSLALGDRLDELDFHLSIDAGGSGWVKIAEIAAALGRPAAGLDARSVRGFVTGSIDLVFRAPSDAGFRYYVADYKSNMLGERLMDYAPEALERAMDEHRYWLQAAFYLVALDRFLEDRLGAEYDYETHCGGALYLFLRGMVGESSRLDAARTVGIHHTRPSAAEMCALRDALGGGRR